MPQKYEKLEPSIIERISRYRNPAIPPDHRILYGENKWNLPERYLQYADQIENFSVREDDIWVVSTPKSGTTWTQEAVWLITHDFDYKKAEESLHFRFPFLEFSVLKPSIPGQQNTIDMAAEAEIPRHIKSHLPWDLLPREIRVFEKRPKLIYITRDPRDIAVSLYHHAVLFSGYLGNIDDFTEEFATDNAWFSPYGLHAKQFWELKNEPNILFLTYEELKKDLKAELSKIASFLNKQISEDEFPKLLDHLSLESMKKNPAVNHDEMTDYLIKLHGVPRRTNFIRKGKVGSYKEELSTKSIQLLEDWMRKTHVSGLWDK